MPIKAKRPLGTILLDVLPDRVVDIVSTTTAGYHSHVALEE